MIQLIRRCLATASACGLLTAIAIYLVSFLGATMDRIAGQAIALHVGVFVILLSTFATQYEDRPFWRGYRIKPPRLVAQIMTALGVFFALHFVLFLLQSHGAAPAIKDGEYILNNHGHIIGVISQVEFIKLKAAELRLFATLWMFFYFVPTAYWWLPHARPHTNERPRTETN